MDTSETYIKMRLAAIPDLGRGDTSLTGHITQIFGDDAVMDEYGNYYAGYRSMSFKLERQDQLQEMVFDLTTERGQRDSVKLFRRWLIEKLPYYPSFLTSYEQLWLAFVMKDKYNKTWTGKEWK